MKNRALTSEVLRGLLNYDPLTGIFTHAKPRQRVIAGAVAGNLGKSGYVKLKVAGVDIRAHQAAWLYCYGAYPENSIDHINGDRSDNRIANLRDVTCRQNLENARVPRPSNKTGFLGVCKTINGKFLACISVGGNNKSLGVFKSAEGAHSAYLFAKRRLHEGCTI
jgi:hypothetical protein